MKTLLSALCFLLSGLLCPCYAADNIVQQEHDLFATLFQGGQVERKPRWDAEHRALYHSGFSRNEAGRTVYSESIRLLSRDGNTLTTIRRQRFTGYADQAFRYHKSEAQAIVPFVFANTLRYIVDRQEERIDFQIWEMDAGNKHLLRIREKLVNLDTLLPQGEHLLYP
ncbi:MAG: hypothetical protein UHH87_09940 [Akkermansia sp.]|nr:hypothetical protein [Akkermansia sp.]